MAPASKLLTCRGNDWTEKFEPLARALAKLKLRTAMLDGEIVHLNTEGTSSFGAIQEDLSEDRPERLTYFLFDILALESYVLTGCNLEDRKRVLERIISRSSKGPIRYSDHIVGHGPEFCASACKAHLEGIVSKRRDGIYLSERTRGWLKVKCTGREEFVIVGGRTLKAPVTTSVPCCSATTIPRANCALQAASGRVSPSKRSAKSISASRHSSARHRR
jgi:bifunctional non-homologous end joining protein LigD